MLSSSIAVSRIGGARRDDLVAGIVLERSLDDGIAALHDLGQDRVGIRPRRLAHRRPVGAHLDEALGDAAAHEVRQRLAGHHLGDEALVDLRPVPLRAGEVELRRERALVGVVAADIGAASGGGLDHHLRAVDVAGDDVDALVDERVGRLGFLHRQRPLAGEDHLRGDRRIDAARAERVAVDVEEHLRDRLRRDEADLLRLRRVAGDDAVQILAHADIAEIGAGVRRVLALRPEAAAMAELDVRDTFPPSPACAGRNSRRRSGRPASRHPD